MGISKEILQSFMLFGDPVQLSGGQNTSIKVGNAVIKPVDNKEQTEWVSNVIYNLDPQGYRVSKPIRSIFGTFVHNGWACTQYEPGKDTMGRVKEKLLVSRLFHRDLAAVRFHDFPYHVNPWSKGHRIAWQSDKLPMDIPNVAKEIISDLLCKVSLKRQYKVQLVHGDLSGNILFDQVLSPLIIDFSPTIAPVEYAEAILVCDCIAWQGSGLSEIEMLPTDEFYKEMIIRAIIFRLAVSAIFAKGNNDQLFISQYRAFKPIIEYIKLD
ncbi:hypothetical protein E5161_06830 [Cohnella pontilimi]|uniref:Aminoglycoside phosphotransferase domain-containing protein n=1 Tax=Cohnella pontilimi TaxID=2564100 RepID=A0A4U0FE62_9BACL|nr:hypothetical protein [Cohnella pontilimi]TJY42564.1 hypothetical protein E5161_06830 [Cohnella pontilimi]